MSLAYANFLPQALSGNVLIATGGGGHTIKMALLTASYTPNLVSHVHYSDVLGSETTGTGYTAGGATMGGLVLSGPTAANSWSNPWSAANNYLYGDIVRPITANGYLYMAVKAGTSGGSTPTWPTVIGEVVADSGVDWVNIGGWISVFTSSVVTWASATFNAAYAVIYDSASNVLVCLLDFGGTQSPASQTFEVEPDPVSGWMVFPPL